MEQPWNVTDFWRTCNWKVKLEKSDSWKVQNEVGNKKLGLEVLKHSLEPKIARFWCIYLFI